MDKIIEFMNGFNIQTIITVTAIAWYFVRDVKSELKLLEAKLDKQADRTDRLYEMFIDLVKQNNIPK